MVKTITQRSDLKDRYIRVSLDDKATIIKFECSLADVNSYTEKEVIGSNWFDMFIGETESNDVMGVFESVFNRSGTWVSYKNDIICKNSKHKRINFHNKLVEVNGIKYIDCIGVEHFEAKSLLPIVAKIYSKK